MDFKRVIKYSAYFLGALIGLWAISALMKVLFAYELYVYFLSKISTAFGLDYLLSRVIAIFISVAAMLVAPWVISFLFLGKRKMELAVITATVGAIFTLSLYLGTDNVFFDRNNGKPIKYYIKTFEGFKFSTVEDFDSRFGKKYKPITQEVMSEYYFWEKTRKLQTIPKVIPGNYFDMITGEPIVWWIEDDNKVIKLFPLPGHDPESGKLLKPIDNKTVLKLKYQEFTIFQYQEKTKMVEKETSKPPATPEKEKLPLKPNKENLKVEDEKEKLRSSVKPRRDDFLEFYFKDDENSFYVDSGVMNLGGSTGFFGFGEWTHQYSVYVEKIIIRPSGYAVVGVCFKGVLPNIRVYPLYGHIFNSRGTKLWTIGYKGTTATDKDGYSYFYVTTGEIKRILYLLAEVDPEAIQKGGFSFNDAYIEFKKKD